MVITKVRQLGSLTLVESNGDYEGTAARKTHFDRSDKKRIPQFVAEIQATIDNIPGKSIRSIARDMGVSMSFLADR